MTTPRALRYHSRSMVRSVLAALLTWGCSEAPAKSTLQIRDSAGIPIVENTDPIWTADDAWIPEKEPYLVIPGDSTLDNPRWIGSVARRHDGSIVVLLENSARLFDSTGRFKANLGGNGDGPGEFRYAEAVSVLPGDSMMISAGGPVGKIAIFAPDGKFVRDENLDFDRFRRLGRWGECRYYVLPDRSRIACGQDSTIPFSATNRPSKFISEGATSPGPGLLRQLRRQFLVPASLDTAYPIGIDIGIEQFGIERASGWTRFVVHPFHATSHLAFGGWPPMIVTISNPEYRLEVWSGAGKLKRVITRPNGRRPPTPGERAAAAKMVETQGQRPGPGGITAEEIAKIPVPDTLPAATGLRVGSEGHIFVQRDGMVPNDSGVTIDVFDRDGRWLGAMKLPTGFWLLDAGRSYLLGIRHDADEVPRVEAYRIRHGK